jgi:hypothetical protein
MPSLMRLETIHYQSISLKYIAEFDKFVQRLPKGFAKDVHNTVGELRIRTRLKTRLEILLNGHNAA